MDPVSFNVIQAGIEAGPVIKHGDTVILNVLDSLGSDRWRVRHNGQFLVIKSEIPLTPGQILKTTAMRFGSMLTLQVQSGEGSIPALLSTAGVPNDSLSSIIIHAFRRFGLAINPAKIRKMRAVLSKLKKADHTSAGVALMLQEKGIDPAPYSIEQIMDFLDGRKKESGHHNKRKGNTNADGEDDGKNIKRQLKAVLEGNAENGSMLHLFNHMKANNRQNWIILPYEVRAGDEELSGVVRIRMNPAGKFDRLVFDAKSPAENWDVSMTWPPAAATGVNIQCSDSKKLNACRKNMHLLPEKLRNLPLIFDDTYKEDGYDKFTLERIKPVKGVNELA